MACGSAGAHTVHHFLPMNTFETPVTHEAIAQYARQLWIESDSPEGRDEEIWLEAEGRLWSAQDRSGFNAMIIRVLAQPTPLRTETKEGGCDAKLPVSR